MCIYCRKCGQKITTTGYIYDEGGFVCMLCSNRKEVAIEKILKDLDGIDDDKRYNTPDTPPWSENI